VIPTIGERSAMRDVLSKAAQIELVIFDVDGVLTDGRLYLGNDGNEYKAFHIRDGHGIKCSSKLEWKWPSFLVAMPLRWSGG
jgi:hypothetical protein